MEVRSMSVDSSNTGSARRRLSFSSTRDFLLRARTRSTSRVNPDIGEVSESEFADVSYILPQPALTPWYPWWIWRQYAFLPQNLLKVLPARNNREAAKAFMEVWLHLGNFLSQNCGASIDEMEDSLRGKALVDDQDDADMMRLIKSLVFTIIGWQTMLFRADCGSCPPTSFAITEEMSGYKGRVHMKLKHSLLASREPLDRCLLGFGLLLPPKNYDLSSSPEHRKAFVDYKDLDASELNAALLTDVAQLQIKWTDCLACHLELDLSTRCLYIFRYPSFCVSSLTSNAPIEGSERGRGPIYACAQSKPGVGHWANASEISSFLEEVVLSYRLLFGQSKRSRHLFRRLAPFAEAPQNGQDQILIDLCGHKRCPAGLLSRTERKHWNLALDFPILRSRLSTLAYEMAVRKPRSWSALWRDKRDSAQWATFWTVIIFGLFSILLSLIQVILQAVQVSIQANSSS